MQPPRGTSSTVGGLTLTTTSQLSRMSGRAAIRAPAFTYAMSSKPASRPAPLWIRNLAFECSLLISDGIKATRRSPVARSLRTPMTTCCVWVFISSSRALCTYVRDVCQEKCVRSYFLTSCAYAHEIPGRKGRGSRKARTRGGRDTKAAKHDLFAALQTIAYWLALFADAWPASAAPQLNVRVAVARIRSV